MNLEIWYSLSNTKIDDINRLEKIIDGLDFKHKIKLLFKPFKEASCPHQEAAYILLKWAEKEYLGLDVFKKLLVLKEVEKSKMETMAEELGLCSPQIKDLFESGDYRFDLKIDYIESRDFLINQTTLMIGVDRVMSINRSDDDIKNFIRDSYYNPHQKKLNCGHVGYCSDEKCQFKEEGVQKVKC